MGGPQHSCWEDRPKGQVLIVRVLPPQMEAVAEEMWQEMAVEDLESSQEMETEKKDEEAE